MAGADPGALARALRATGRGLLRAPRALVAVPVLLWAGLIWKLSSQAVPLPENPSPVWELLSNLAHAPLFGLLGLGLAALLLRRAGEDWPRRVDGRHLAVLLGVVGYGILDEWHQSRVPGRDSSVLDIVTDGVAVSMVLWIVHTLGAEALTSRRLWTRLLLGVGACGLAAGLATAFS